MESATSPPPQPPRGPVPKPSGAFVAEALGEDPGQRGNKWWTLVAVCLGTFMLLPDITIVQRRLGGGLRAQRLDLPEPAFCGLLRISAGACRHVRQAIAPRGMGGR
jgi:hypothetical protein